MLVYFMSKCLWNCWHCSPFQSGRISEIENKCVNEPSVSFSFSAWSHFPHKHDALAHHPAAHDFFPPHYRVLRQLKFWRMCRTKKKSIHCHSKQRKAILSHSKEFFQTANRCMPLALVFLEKQHKHGLLKLWDGIIKELWHSFKKVSHSHSWYQFKFSLLGGSCHSY